MICVGINNIAHQQQCMQYDCILYQVVIDKSILAFVNVLHEY